MHNHYHHIVRARALPVDPDINYQPQSHLGSPVQQIPTDRRPTS